MTLIPAPLEPAATGSGRHIAVVAPPLPGHWDPLKALASRLVARGHRVTFVHLPDAQAMLAGTGFGFAPVADRGHGSGALARYKAQLAAAPSLSGFFAMIRATAAMSAMLLETLPDALQRIGAEAVIADETEAAGAMAARHLGLPLVTSMTGLPLLRDPQVPPPFVSWPYRAGFLARRRNRGGYRVADLLVRPIRGVHRHYAARWGMDVEEATSGSALLQVAQCPAALDFPRRSPPLSLRHCGPFRPREQPAIDLPDDGRPLIYCSLGSLQGNRPDLFAAMTGACADLGARAVVAHGGLLDEEAARRLPGDPVIGAFWPQPAVLPHCAAAILHGGFNTVLDALSAGVPMVVVPLAFEQPGTAARVVRTGAGRAILSGRLTRERLRRELGQVLTGAGYRSAAEEMGTKMAALAGAEQAAALVDEAFRTGRTPSLRA